VIVGRNEKENNILSNLADKKDILIEITGCGSPIALLQDGNKDDIATAASICARYSDCNTKSASARIWSLTQEVKTITTHPLSDEIIKKYHL
jgi:predicted ribosome quality control (RQC) complex YloA/Tae2 family protein